MSLGEKEKMQQGMSLLVLVQGHLAMVQGETREMDLHGSLLDFTSKYNHLFIHMIILDSWVI